MGCQVKLNHKKPEETPTTTQSLFARRESVIGYAKAVGKSNAVFSTHNIIKRMLYGMSALCQLSHSVKNQTVKDIFEAFNRYSLYLYILLQSST